MQRQPLHEALRVAVDPLAVLQRILQQSLALLPNADGASLEVRRDLDVLEYLTTVGTLSPHAGLRLPVRGSLSGLALLTGSTQLCTDALNDPRVNASAIATTGIRSMLCIPLSDQLSSVAVLKVASTQVGAFTSDDAQCLHLLRRFLNATISAATDLAVVTADVLTGLYQLDSSRRTGLDWQQATAQFVANVMTPGLVDRVSLQHRIEAVLEDAALDIVFQPVVEIQSGKIVACEALSRFRQSATESPDWWFDAAHRVGLGVELELLAVCSALALMAKIPAHLHVAVNVGPETILSEEFFSLLDAADLTRLTLELTEHVETGNYEASISALQPLRQKGLRLSVDDTGSGYSGLNHILRLRPDIIKLDREMVAGIHRDPARRAMATAIVSFADAIGAQVIAEGLEAQEEVECLRELGVGYAQGFIFGRPMPLDQFLLRCAE